MKVVLLNNKYTIQMCNESAYVEELQFKDIKFLNEFGVNFIFKYIINYFLLSNTLID